MTKTRQNKHRNQSSGQKTHESGFSPLRPAYASANGTLPLLTFDDILRGGDSPEFSRKEIPELKKNGSPGVVLYRLISSGAMIRLLELGEAGKENISQREQIEITARAVAEMLVHPDGSPLMTYEQALKIPYPTLSAIVIRLAFGQSDGVSAEKTADDTESESTEGNEQSGANP